LFFKTPNQNVNTETPTEIAKTDVKMHEEWQVVDMQESPDYVKQTTPSLAKQD